MELEELRQRLLLRSKSTDIPPIAHPVQISEVALSAAASKLKWETSLSPVEIAARLGINGAKTDPPRAKAENATEDTIVAAPGVEQEPIVQKPEAAVAACEDAPHGAEPVTTPAEPISILADTVQQLSAPTEAFREAFEHLNVLRDPIDSATVSTEQAVKRITVLFDHLSSLANNFQSMRAFAEQVRMLSASFEPMKGLDAQLEVVMLALYTNVKEVGAALAPVKVFQAKLYQLMEALDSIERLEGKISGLAETFRPTIETAQPPAALEAEKPAQVAPAA